MHTVTVISHNAPFKEQCNHNDIQYAQIGSMAQDFTWGRVLNVYVTWTEWSCLWTQVRALGATEDIGPFSQCADHKPEPRAYSQSGDCRWSF